MRQSRNRFSRSGEEIDPTGGLANLLDVMLVFCCGLMAALIMSWNLQGIFSADLSQEERENMMQAISRIVNVTEGQKLAEIPPIGESGAGGGEGFQEVGTVFRDPNTGELILIEGLE